MNDNTVDLAGARMTAAFKEAMRNAYTAGRAKGLKEGVDLIALHGKAADTQSSMNLCVVMAGALGHMMDEAPDFPEYMR